MIQEVDIATSRVLFEWHASDHFDINESDFPPGRYLTSSDPQNGQALLFLENRRNGKISITVEKYT